MRMLGKISSIAVHIHFCRNFYVRMDIKDRMYNIYL